MIKTAVISLSLLLFFGALWGGSYVLHALPVGHWAVMPTLLTTVIIGASGFGLLGFSVETL